MGHLLVGKGAIRETLKRLAWDDFFKSLETMEPARGIEPPTYALRMRCSTIEATPAQTH